jgi:uncharacterized metal-binding protein
MTGDSKSGNGGETLIFTCAGAAHSGQVSNKAGVSLMQNGTGALFCIAAVGADVSDKMERARSAKRRVVIDGCEDHCALKIMERAGLPVDVHVDVTELGVEKRPDQPQLINDSRKVLAFLKPKLEH